MFKFERCQLEMCSTRTFLCADLEPGLTYASSVMYGLKTGSDSKFQAP